MTTTSEAPSMYVLPVPSENAYFPLLSIRPNLNGTENELSRPDRTPAKMEDSMNMVEEWMYSNTFIVDLEETFARWRLLETSLPDGHALKLYLQNSLQATGKLRALWLAHEEKRPDTEQQLRSWVNKVEAQVGDEGKKFWVPRRWTISRMEPMAFTGMPTDPSLGRSPNNSQETHVPSGKGNVFSMEDYFASEKPVELLMASACPQLIPAETKAASTPAPPPKSLSTLASLGVNTSSMSGTIGRTTTPAALSTSTTPTGTTTGSNSAASSHKRIPSGGPNSSTTESNAAAAATQKSTSSSAQSQPSQAFTHLLVEVNDLIMLVGQEAVLSLSLFADDRFITEEFSINLPNQSPIPLDDKSRKVLFRDIPSELVQSNLWLVAKIVRFGKMKYNEAKPSAKDPQEGYPVRRPYALAVLSLSELINQAQTELEVQDAMSSAQGSSGMAAAAKAATLRRRQFSNAPRPAGGTSPLSSSDGASSGPDSPVSSRPVGNAASASRKLNTTLRQSAMRHAHQQSIQEGTNSLSMRALSFVQSANQFMTLHAPTRDDIFPEIHNFIINNMRDKSSYLTFLPKAKGLLVTVSRFEGAFAAVQHHPALLSALPVSISLPLSLPDQGSGTEALAPRNDLYVTLEEAYLHDDKSFEIVVEARNKFGAPATVVASASQIAATVSTPLGMLVPQLSSSNLFEGPNKNLPLNSMAACPALPLWAGYPTTPSPHFSASIVHRSIPYHHKKDPKPAETFKIDLSRFSDLDHLYMTIRHVSENGKFTDVAFTTLRLYQQDSSFIPNGNRKLNTYKPGSLAGPGSTDSVSKRGTVLNAIGGSRATIMGSTPTSGGFAGAAHTMGHTKSNSDEGQIASYLKNEDSLTRSNKTDFLTVNVNLVSTKITENIPLRALLNWQNSTTPDMSPLLEKCAHLSRKDIVNFYKDIFDTLLDLLVLLDDVRPAAFQTLMAILATCQSDPRNAHYDQLDQRGHLSLKHWVDRYLEEGITNGKVYPFLMDSLHKLIEAVSSDPKANHRTLKLALKASPLLIKFILRSRQVALQTSALSGSAPTLPDYSGATAPRLGKGTDTISTGMMPSKGSAPRGGGKMPIMSTATKNSDPKSNDSFLSHGFCSDSDPTSPNASHQVLFNPLFNLPHVKLQHLYASLSDDSTFRKRYLALLDSFSSLLVISEPSLITLQALLVKAFPQMLQSSVFLLDKEHTARVLERFLAALDDADQVQLNVEKLLLLEHFQFSPYVGLSVLIKHIKIHARQSDEERFIAMRILKSMVRSVLSQTFIGSLSPMSPIATIEAHPGDEMDAQYTSASILTAQGGTAGKTATGKASDVPPTGPTGGSRQGTAISGISPASVKTRVVAADIFAGQKSQTASTEPDPRSSTPLPLIPSRALYLVLLDLIPTLTRILKKTDESDSETRRDISTTFLAILKLVSLKRLRAHLLSGKTKHTKRTLESVIQLTLLLLKTQTYPLGWSDLVLYQLKRFSSLIEVALVPVVLGESGVDSKVLGEVESKIWTRLFCTICYALRHPSLQLESYVANRDSIIAFLGGKDQRLTLARGLWALWQRYELFRIQLVPDAVPALLVLSSSPNIVLSSLAKTCYLYLISRETQILTWMNTMPKSDKVYATVQPARARVGSIPVRIVNAPTSAGSATTSPRTSTSADGSTLSPRGSGSFAPGTSPDGSQGSAEGLTRARAQNTSGISGPQRPVGQTPKVSFGAKRTTPVSSSGSSGSVASIGRQATTIGISGGTSSTSSALSGSGSGSTVGASVQSAIGAGSANSSSVSSVSSSNSASNSVRASSEFATPDSITGHSGYGFTSSGSSSNLSGIPSPPSIFPRIEVGTIQALEEMSKSGAWSQKNLEKFFTACKEVAGIDTTADKSGRRKSLMATGTGTGRNGSSGSLEPMNHPALLTMDTSLLPSDLKEAITILDEQAPSSIASTLLELPSLRPRLGSFCSDMMSLVLLLASLRDLPQGAEYDEERAYALTQLMTYLRQTQHADAYLKYAFKLSKMYEEAGQYTEAAYAVLLHADMLDWSDRMLPGVLTSPAMPSSKRKHQLLNQAISLFDKGKAWEDAIKVSSDLVVALRNQLFDYPSLATQLRLQADLYMKIAEQDRFFSNYFYVAYYGTGFPNALRRKSFIYRGLELERIPHFISRMEKKFPNAEVLKTMDPPASDLTDKNKERAGQFLQIFTVQPSSEDEMNGLQKQPSWLVPNMPEGTRKYHAANNVRVFQYSRPFKQPGAPKTTDDNAFEHLWISQVYVATEDSFPNIQRRLEIVSISEIVRSPVENAAFAVLQKNNELAEIVTKLQTTPNEIKVDRLSMALHGILDAAVNGGTAKYQQAFLSDKFITESKNNKKQQEAVGMLQKALLAQLQVVSRGLSLHGELCPSNLLALHKRLESQYERMVVQIGAVAGAPTIQSSSISPRQHAQNTPTNTSTSTMGSPKVPATVPDQPKGAMRIKETEVRPSIIGFAAQMMANTDSPPQ